MSNENAVQVSNSEDQMAGMVAMIAQFLQDATKLPTLRKELEALRAECESLKRAKSDLEVEIQLERDERARFANLANDAQRDIHRLNTRLSSLQHKFDTIQGIVAAAMAEAKADEPKPAIVNPTEPKPWTPSEPLRSSGL